MRLSVAGVVLGLLGGSYAYAQSVISAHSGVIHYVEGRVLLGDTPVELKFAQFPDLKENQELRTEEGRAEILLTPGAFLRIGENSAIRMVSNHLTDTRVEVLSGSALLECTEILKDNALTLVYKGNTMLVEKAGLYRVDSDPPRFRVYEGQAIVRSESGQLTLKAGKETPLDGVLTAGKFDNKTGDDLYRWSSRRSGYVAAANVSAARSIYNSGSAYTTSGWQFNPWFGMYTFVPFGGMLYSPFGYSFWNPYSAYWFAPGYYYGPGGYYGGNYGGGSSSGNRAAYTSASSRTSGAFSGGGLSNGGRVIGGGFGDHGAAGISGGGMSTSGGGFGGHSAGAMSGGGGGGFGSHGGGAAASGGGHSGGGRGGR